MPARTRFLVAALLVAVPEFLLAQTGSRAALQQDLERLTTREGVAKVPSVDSVAPGPRSIAAGTMITGTVVARGPVDVRGRVNGTVVSLSGDVTVHRGGLVTGDALSVGGRVNADSGVVLGEMRSMAALPALLGTAPAVAEVRTLAQQTIDAARLVAVSFGVLLLIAVGVLLFAGHNLDEVVTTIEHRFARVFWIGVLGQVCLLPALAVLVVALTLSLIGILLIPFAVVAYVIAAAGLVTLGFLAVARLVGGALWRGRGESERMRTLVALAVGICLFFGVWMVAALLTWAPLAATVIRAAALAVTWAAMTLGLGATLQSRAGTHRRRGTATRSPELAAWQTPTPVAGVAAARRQTVPVREAM